MGSALASLKTLRVRMLRRREDESLREVADFLGGVPLFAPLSSAMRVELADAVHSRIYRPREVIYFEDDPGIGLYVVRRGSVQLCVTGEDGAEHAIRTASERELIGANGLLGGGILRRAETARAVGETHVLGLFSPEFRKLQRRHPGTGAAVAVLLARHFALCFAEARALLAERAGKVAAATEAGDARSRATARMAEAPGF